MPDTQVISDCILEYDRARGVLYVHHFPTGSTILRVCGLRTRPTPDPICPGQPIDITLRDGRALVQYPDARIGGTPCL